jgi:hypothetical protein
MVRYVRRFPGPVRVKLVSGERHVLDHATDPRIMGDAAGPPDLVMLPAARLGVARVAPPAVAPDLLDAIRSGRAGLVLDASGEGPAFSEKLATAIHGLLRAFDLPAKRVVYLTQNRDFRSPYQAWCGEGVTPVTVIEYDYYLSRFFRQHLETGAATYAERLARFEARAQAREKRFVCLNFSPRPSKLLLLQALLRDGLWDEGFISFPGFDTAAHGRAVSKPAMARDLLSLPGLEAEGAALAPWLDALDAKGSAILGVRSSRRNVKALSGDMALDEYNRAWFTVITETEVIGARRITEKPFKALANFSPLIVWGNAGSLELMRGWDFKTFGGLLDEAYDGEANPARRFEMVLGEIRRLCALPQQALADAERSLAGVLAHNAERCLVQMPRIYRDRYEPELIDRLVGLTTRRKA